MHVLAVLVAAHCYRTYRSPPLPSPSQHGRDSEKPIRYSHMDIAGSSGLPPGVVTAAPVPALAKFFVYGKYEC